MSVRLIAQDLYRLQREVEKLEKQLEITPTSQRDDLKDQLRKVKAERDQMRHILEGAKEPLPYRKPL